MGRLSGAAMFVSALAGCFSEPSFSATPADAGGDADGSVEPVEIPKVEVATVSDEVTVTNRDFQLVFSTITPYMPRAFTFTGESSNRFAPGSFDEDGMGMTFTKGSTGYVLAYGKPIPASATIGRPVIDESGPARASVSIAWTGPSPCNGLPLQDNLSRFTLYPDGRLVRRDKLDWKMACTHIAGSHQTFAVAPDTVSYIKLDTAEAMYSGGNQWATVEDTKGASGYGCLEQGGTAIGVTYGTPAATNEWEFFEISATPGGAAPSDVKAISMSYFFQELTNLPANGVYYASTQIAGRRTTCRDLIDTVIKPYQQPPLVQGATYDRAWGGYRADADTLLANGGLPAGFVVMKAIPGTTLPTVTRTGGPSRARVLVIDEDYRAQVSGSDAVFWFVDELLAGEGLVFQ